MSFDTLGLAPELLRAVNAQGYTTPSPIQAQAIPLVLAGRDLLAGAQTGTGKTAAFVLPMLQRLMIDNNRAGPGERRPRALILTPTRELAAQVHQSLRDYGSHLRPRSTAIFGGVGIQPQIQALRRGLDFIVATPGRLIDHMQQKTVDLSNIQVLVLDEGDRMLDMGFLPAMRKVLAALPRQNRQTLLFSATFSDPIRELAGQFMRDPAQVQVSQRNSIATTVSHRVHPVDVSRKRELLLELLSHDSRRQTLVFGRTKHGCDKLARFLEQHGLHCAVIHGNKSQGARTRALADFKGGRATVMVATDIAARGLDIDQLPAVINFDLPMVAEDYVHRIGRTGRAGAEGQAISLVAPEESRLLRDIERMLGRSIDVEPVLGFEPSQPLAAARPAGRAPGRAPGNAPGRGAGRGGAGRPSDRDGAAPGGRRNAARPTRQRNGRSADSGQVGTGAAAAGRDGGQHAPRHADAHNRPRRSRRRPQGSATS
ncbi:MAG: DEAD/DEAH box helicase [Lysobacterales bacterium]